MEWPILVGLTVVDAFCTYVCFQKGKRGLGTVGVFGLFGLAPFLVWFPLFGALGPAEPGSAWARYRTPSQPTANESGWDDLGLHPRPRARTHPDDDLKRRAEIATFVDEARARGVLDDDTQRKLLAMLETKTVPASAPTLFETVIDGPGPTPATLPTPVMAPPLPTPSPRATPPPPPPPPQQTRLSRIWEAAVSDVALHGLSYLGVLLTFVAILGFLLFAFTDIPDPAQPFIELGIALIFFAWAWVLRRQQAEHVADGMELVGGMVLPLIVFAGMVDNAPFPPDFSDGGLIVAMVVTSVLIAGGYAFYTSRNPDSTLRYLVAPLLWLAGLAAGFLFKTDEPLVSDAITRLVSPQPALASVVIAATLLAALRRSEHRLSRPAIRSALVGVPVAFLLTVSMTFGEDWERSWPIAILGAATFASVEILARWYDRQAWMPSARPLLLAGVLLPLIPSVENGWGGLIVVAAYLLLFELTRRLDSEARTAMTLAAVGAGVGALLALEDPWSTLIVYTGLTVWAQLRRTSTSEGTYQALTGVAALAPVGVGLGLHRLLEPGLAWLLMAGILAVASLTVRLARVSDDFWRLWLPGVGAAIALGSALHWDSSQGTEVWTAPALALVGVAIALSPAGRQPRLWGASVSFVLALGIALETAGYTTSVQSQVWAGIGLVLVLAANIVRRAPASHVAVIGHLVGTGSLLFFPTGPTLAVVLGAWALGWVASLIGSELEGDTVTALLDRAAGWVVSVMAVVSTPLAAITALDLWDNYASNRSWNGVTLALIGVGYAAAARLFDSQRPAGRTLAYAATVASLGGIALAVPDSWPMIIASMAVVSVAWLVGAALRQTWFVWAAWADTVLLAVLLGERAGVRPASLHLVALAWGVALLVGGLAGDDIIAGRRHIGEWLRVGWLRYPCLIGAGVMPLALAPVFAEPPPIYGWWSIGIAAVYLLVAYLVRAGSVTVPGLGLLAVSFTALFPVSPLDEPWVYIALATPLVAFSWVFARYQSTEAAKSVWLRWDLAPLVVAHLIGGFALLTAFENEDILLTLLVFGLLSVLLGVWRRGRVWVDAGNLLIVLAAIEAGGPWPALALAATSFRGIIGARIATESDRFAYLLVGAVSAGLTWLAVIDWQAYPADRAIDYSGYLFGALALVLAAAARTGRLRDDTLVTWGGLAIVGLLAASIPVAFGGDGITGFGLSTGFALLALSLHLLWRGVDASLRLLPPPALALAWLTLIPAAGWDRSTALRVSVVVFGMLMVVVAEIARRRVPSPDDGDRALSAALVWAGLAGLGVLIAASFYRGDAGDGYALTIGVGLLSGGLARAAMPLALPWLREGSMVTGLATINILAHVSGWEQTPFAIGLVVMAVTATVASLWSWRTAPGSPWVRALVVLALVTNIETLLIAFDNWPARALLVAVLLSVAAQTLAVGIVRNRPHILAIGPPAVAAALILGVAENVSGSAQWYTIPIGLALLSEVEILRAVRRGGGDTQGGDVIVLEWAGIGLLAGPGLVEMFTTRLTFGLIPFAMAAGILLWAIVSRVRRRAIAAFSIAVVSAVLLLFAAAAGAAPASAVFWILAAGIGVSVMLVAGLLESYRSRRGQAMARLGVLLEGWE